MRTDDNVRATIEGAGKLRAARVYFDDELAGRIGIVSERGWRTFPLAGLVNNGHDIVLHALSWKDVIGDREPELWIEISKTRWIGGEAESFITRFVIVCRAIHGDAQCSKPIVTASDESIDGVSFAGTLEIRGSSARVRIDQATRLTRLHRHRITRPVRLFARG